MAKPTQREQFEAEIGVPTSATGIGMTTAVWVIDMVLRTALSHTIDDLDAWIDEFVPKRTGQLRDSLKMNLRSSRVVNRTLLKLYFGTHLNYAEFVNDMTTSQVAHDGEIGYAYYYGNYGRITLDDPHALGNFFGEMITFAQSALRTNIQNAIRTLWFVRRQEKQAMIQYTVVRRT